MEFPSGCLGKLPLHGDFIRHNATAGEVNEFDQWIQEGIYQGYDALQTRWDESFDAAPTFRFMYCSPRSRRVMAGLFKPSVDRAGRRYPFMVYSVLDAAAIGTEVDFLPNSMEQFVRDAGNLIQSSGDAANLNAFLATLEPLKFVPDMAGARREFGRFVLTSNALNYWASMFGDAQDPRRFAAVGGAVEGAGTRPPGALALRLPYSQDNVEVSFWLELARRLTDGRALPTLTFWNDADTVNPARLHIAWGALSPRYFLPFVFPSRSSLEVRDLSSPDRMDGRWMEYGRARFDEVLSDPSLKLTDLLQKLLRSRGA
jgi:type VI secretion system protein ImpM